MRSPDWKAGELGLLVGAGLFALAFHLWLPTRMPSDEDYREVANVLAREAQPGDAVLLHPWWTERARLFVPETLPVVGYIDDEGAALEKHPRIWVLSQPGLPYAGNGRFEGAFLPHRAKVGEERRFGPLRLTLYRNDRARPALFSAVDAISTLHVYLEQGGARTDCPWDGQRFRCPGKDLHVAAEWHELLYRPERCLWMHPPGGDGRLVAEVAQVPAGRLRLEAGIIWEQAWKHDANLTPVAAVAENPATGAVLERLDIVPGMEGFSSADATLAAPAPVRVWTQSSNEAIRDVCVELRVLGPSASEGP